MIFLRTFLSLLLAFGAAAPAQQYQGKQLVTPDLVADATAVAAGQPFTVGALLKMHPGWHTYWQFSGDSGLPPQIEWDLPEGFTAGPIQWPIGTAHPSEGDQLTYIYEGETMLMVTITPPATLPAGEVAVKARLRWLVCEETCIPGDGEVALTMPTTGTPQPANTELFAKWRAQLPKTGGMPFQVKWEIKAEYVALQVSGLPADFSAELLPLPPEGVTPGHPKVSAIAADGLRTFTVPVKGTSAEPWRAVLVTQKAGAPREGWQLSAGSAVPASSAVAASPPPAPVTPGLLGVLGLAFVGGLILNLMPCVLPVIALKIFGFVQQAGEAPERVFRLGLAFVAGVFAFFLGLAALVAGLHMAGRGIAWGFQFQNAYILTVLIALVFIFALSMFGVFEVTLSSEASTKMDSLARREGYSGAFVHGMFTTLLGTSCTAPFLGPVLGFAFVQPPLVVFLIFGVIAAGMSLPYFLLTWQPAWMRFLPKPGVWMERLKQFMGFILLGVVVWLLDSVGSRGPDAVVAVSAFLLALGVACWLYGAYGRRPLAWLFMAAFVAGGWWFFIQGKLMAQPAGVPAMKNEEGGIAWQPFTLAGLDELVKSGQPVFIDFTASWCLNCKYNEKFVIETPAVRAAFTEKKVVPVKADWSNGDPAITALLKKFGRIGVPVYVLYPGRGADPVVLPEILTQELLLNQLGAVKP